MKKFLFFFLISALIFTFSACDTNNTESIGNTSTSSNENTNNEQENDEYLYTATLDLYPEIMISAKSKDALDEVLDILLDSSVGINISNNNSSDDGDDRNITDNTTTITTTDNRNNQSDLNETEKKIFNLLVNALDSFPHPSSVKVIKFHAYQSSENRYFLTLTSENNFGGYLTDLYELDSDGAYGSTYSESQLKNMSTILGLTTPTCDISKINKALQQYYSEQGW